MTFVRRLLVVEAVAFATAALIHLGILFRGSRDPWAGSVFEDPSAGTAESIIAAVLLAGALVSWRRPAWARWTAIAVQGFALAGTLIGLYLFIRLKPDHVLDIAFHIVIAAVLAAGMVIAVRLPRFQADR